MTTTVAETLPLDADGTTTAAPNMHKVTRDSLWILANYGSTAVSGMLFWVVAARILPPHQLGTETAILSIITAAANMAAVGPGNGLLAMLPASGRAASPLFRTALSSVGFLAGAYGLIAGVLVTLFIPLAIPAYIVVPAVAAVTVIWSMFVFKDYVIGSFDHPKWATMLNGSLSLLKLGLLLVFGIAIGMAVQPVLSSAVIPAVFAVVIWALVLMPKMILNHNERDIPRGDVPRTDAEVKQWMTETRRPFLIFALRDGTASSLNMGIAMSLTFLVTAFAGAQSGAVFALCYQISSVVDLVVVGATGSLILNNAAGHASAAQIALKMWFRAFVSCAALATAVVICSPVILSILGEFYVKNGGVQVLSLLLIASVLRTPFEVWNALLRADHKTGVLLRQNAISAAILLPAVILSALFLGVAGVAMAILVVTAFQGVLGFCGMLVRRRQA